MQHPKVPTEIKKGKKSTIILAGALLYGVTLIFLLYFIIKSSHQNELIRSLTARSVLVSKSLAKTHADYLSLKNQDQYKINQNLKKQIDDIHTGYSDSIKYFQSIQDLKSEKQDTITLDNLYVAIVSDLGEQNFASATSELSNLKDEVSTMQAKLAAQSIPQIPGGGLLSVNNSPPGNGFSQQSVKTDTGTFAIDIIAADMGSTKVIVDTASDSDCSNNCPAFPLSTYVSRNGAYAGINGTFFCPPDYPSCAGKVNTFDTLLMNKNKYYFNSANNVYSTVPAVIFLGSSARWVGRSLEWGRDTGVDAVIAMQPALVLNSQIVYSAGGNGKFDSPGYRSFIATKGSMVYIGFIFNATMADSAHVMKTLGMENAMNLDEGGSSALMVNGSYLVGPGRNLPNAVLFVHK